MSEEMKIVVKNLCSDCKHCMLIPDFEHCSKKSKKFNPYGVSDCELFEGKI